MEELLRQLLTENNIECNKLVDKTIVKLIENAKIAELAESILEIKKQIIDIFLMQKEIEGFKENHIYIKNANVKEDYEYVFDLTAYPNIVIEEIRNLDKVDLGYDSENRRIYGRPTLAYQVELEMVFHSKLDSFKSRNIKSVAFIVNADPKDLWKDIPSQQGDLFAKKDEDAYHGDFLDKKIVVASKRGRSHAHTGTFRDDDFKIAVLSDGWEIVAVADGAGSAKYARQGSKIATEFTVNRFNKENILQELDNLAKLYFGTVKSENEKIDSIEGVLETEVSTARDANEIEPKKNGPSSLNDNAAEDPRLKSKHSIIKILYSGVRDLFGELTRFANEAKIELKDLHSTLVFALCKKFDFGYAVLTFGVGDSPVNILLEGENKALLLNLMDIGEQSGGTRFITMRSIFESPDMGTRFGLNSYKDFSKLFLMTDGIYDPKFVTENRLEDWETWESFLNDLNGENEDKIKVDFADDAEIEKQLLQWLDFWSKGNHDDRTLAIIY